VTSERHHPTAIGRRHAFTIIEIIVALVVSSIVVLGGRLAVERMTDAASAATRAAQVTDAAANSDRLLRTILARLEVGTDESRRFGGDERSVHFTTWCDTPAGWLERCDAVLAVEAEDSGRSLILHLATQTAGGNLGPQSIVLRSSYHQVTLRYLNDPRAGGRWFSKWDDAITAPLALGVIVDGDTSIIRIGERE
jgi:prepilin-type N-terminal cleavage/methylation domain-containing protein